MMRSLVATGWPRSRRAAWWRALPALLCFPFAISACRHAGAPAAQPEHSAPAGGAATAGSALAARPSRLTLFVTTRVQNTTEPCGCTSDPLGDVARVGALLRDTQGRGLLLDAGGLRYKPTPLPPEKQPQARLKADFLERTWRDLGALLMLQPADLMGPEGARELSPRVVSNLDGLPAAQVQREAIRDLAGVRVGVLGLAAPGATWPTGIHVTDPVPVAEKTLASLRRQGAAITVALTGLPRDAARRLARKLPDLDILVAGADDTLPDGVAKPEQVGKTLLVVPAGEAQRVIRINVYTGSDGSLDLSLRPTESQRQEAHAQLREQIRQAEQRLRDLKADPQSEPAFVQSTTEEIARLRNEQMQLGQPLPSAGAYLTAELVPLGRALRRDDAIAQAMQALDRQIGEANLKAAAPPIAALDGQPSYVGAQACQGACHFHDDAVAFWQKTLHAQAFTTLVRAGKELSYDCVGCHAVAFEEPGGSSLRSLIDWQRRSGPQAPPSVADLRHVQCETCHGPGSAHVSSPSKHPIPVRQPDQDRCLVCHTKDHSDTFDWMPYLRDILGPGHGADRRAALPAGPTAHELRSAAIKKRSANGHAP